MQFIDCVKTTINPNLGASVLFRGRDKLGFLSWSYLAWEADKYFTINMSIFK